MHILVNLLNPRPYLVFNLNFLFSLLSSLPLLLVPLSRHQMQIHFVPRFSLPLQHFLPLIEPLILQQSLSSMFPTVIEQPLQKHNIVLEHPLGHFSKTSWLVDFQLLQRILNYLQVPQIILWVFWTVVQSHKRQATRMKSVQQLSISYPVCQRLNVHVLCLDYVVDPS